MKQSNRLPQTVTSFMWTFLSLCVRKHRFSWGNLNDSIGSSQVIKRAYKLERQVQLCQLLHGAYVALALVIDRPGVSTLRIEAFIKYSLTFIYTSHLYRVESNFRCVAFDAGFLDCSSRRLLILFQRFLLLV